MGASQSAGKQQKSIPNVLKPAVDTEYDRDLRAADTSSERPNKARMARLGPPAWQGMSGARRIQAEFKHVKQQIDAGQLPQIFGIYMVSDDLYRWRFKLKNFDNDCQSGRDLNADLAQLFKYAAENIAAGSEGHGVRYSPQLLSHLAAGKGGKIRLLWRCNFHNPIQATPSF